MSLRTQPRNRDRERKHGVSAVIGTRICTGAFYLQIVGADRSETGKERLTEKQYGVSHRNREKSKCRNDICLFRKEPYGRTRRESRFKNRILLRKRLEYWILRSPKNRFRYLFKNRFPHGLRRSPLFGRSFEKRSRSVLRQTAESTANG